MIIAVLIIAFKDELPTGQIFEVSASMSFQIPDGATVSGSNVNYVGPSSTGKVRVDVYVSKANVPYAYCNLVGTPSCRSSSDCENTYTGCNFNGNTFMQNFYVSKTECTQTNAWDGSSHVTATCEEKGREATCFGGEGSLTCTFPPPIPYGGEGGSGISVTIRFQNKASQVTTMPLTTTVPWVTTTPVITTVPDGVTTIPGDQPNPYDNLGGYIWYQITRFFSWLRGLFK